MLAVSSGNLQKSISCCQAGANAIIAPSMVLGVGIVDPRVFHWKRLLPAVREELERVKAEVE